MLATNLTIASETYNLTGQDLVKSIRNRTGDASGIDQVLTISHLPAKVLGVQNVRRLVRLDYLTTDANAKTTTASVYMVVNHPQSSAVANATLIAMMNTLASFITASSNANVTQLLNGEY